MTTTAHKTYEVELTLSQAGTISQALQERNDEASKALNGVVCEYMREIAYLGNGESDTLLMGEPEVKLAEDAVQKLLDDEAALWYSYAAAQMAIVKLQTAQVWEGEF